jgi:hypothetical protein
MKGDKGTTLLFNYDVGQMTTSMKIMYVFGVIVFFCAIFYVISQKLLSDPMEADPIKKRREEVLKRKQK